MRDILPAFRHFRAFRGQKSFTQCVRLRGRRLNQRFHKTLSLMPSLGMDRTVVWPRGAAKQARFPISRGRMGAGGGTVRSKVTQAFLPAMPGPSGQAQPRKAVSHSQPPRCASPARGLENPPALPAASHACKAICAKWHETLHRTGMDIGLRPSVACFRYPF